MPRDMYLALGGGAASAVFFLSLMTGAPSSVILVYVAPLPLFLVGLALGPVPGTLAGAVGAAIVALLGGLLVGAVYLFIFAAPSVFLVRQALLNRSEAEGVTHWYPPGLLLGWATVMGGATLVVVALILAGTEGGIEGQVQALLPSAFEYFTQSALEPDQVVALQIYANNLPALLLCTWLFMTVINGVVAQNVLVRLGRNRRPTPDILDIEAPNWALFAVAAAILLFLVGNGNFAFVGRNLALVLAVPYFFVGLSVIHALARRAVNKTVILAVFYGLLIFLGIIAMLAVMVLGLVETWVGLRQRAKGPST
jgi:hypothetical protein